MSESLLCCPCDLLVHPPKPDIPAGLTALPRQLAGFPEYRRAMLREIPTHSPLAGWRAREGDDRGVMLIEMWAYVLDILAFYDERIANETYLLTAVRRPSLRRLVELIGYRPRPGLAASVVLAAIAEGPQPAVVPAGTGLRSGAFDGEPPQVFETSADTVIEPKRNRWTITPIRGPEPRQELLFETASTRLGKDDLVLFRDAGSGMVAARVTAVESVRGRDGVSYRRARLEPEPRPDEIPRRGEVEVLSPTLTAAPHGSLGARAVSEDRSGTGTWIVLDGLYPQLEAGSSVIVGRAAEVRPAGVAAVVTVQVPINDEDDAPTLPASRILVQPKLPVGWTTGVRVQFEMVDAGRLTQVARTHLVRDDVDGAALESPIEPPETGSPDALLLHDAEEYGEKVGGTVVVDPADPLGRGSISLNDDQAAFERPLRTPVAVLGNLLAATRGESVRNEVLGSGDAAQGFQSFKLARNPLTYLADASAPDGRRSTLEIRVNGILWTEVPSFFGVGPGDEVYIVRQNDDDESTVTFGDGITGSRLPTGVDNIVASYRFGVGAAKPPANSITQLARPTAGLRRVLNPVAAGGGRDADRPEDIRTNGPASALTLGRAISLLDFEALAYDFGVLNGHATWAWDERSQRAVLKLWYIADGGDIAQELRSYLIGQADPNTPLQVAEAVPVPSRLVIDLEVDSRHDSDTVETAVIDALGDAATGLLALRNVPIGAPLFRSRIFERVLSVKGTVSVRGITLNGRAVAAAITAAEGRYHDFMPGLSVGNTAAGDMLIPVAPDSSAGLVARFRRVPRPVQAFVPMEVGP